MHMKNSFFFRFISADDIYVDGVCFSHASVCVLIVRYLSLRRRPPPADIFPATKHPPTFFCNRYQPLNLINF